jgi:hypothetical protein
MVERQTGNGGPKKTPATATRRDMPAKRTAGGKTAGKTRTGKGKAKSK